MLHHRILPSLPHRSILTLLLAGALGACGGGSSSDTTVMSSSTIAQADALDTGLVSLSELGMPETSSRALRLRSRNARREPEPPVSAPVAEPVPAATSPGSIQTPLVGVTIDDISGLQDIVQSLGRLAKKPTARIVFDENVQPGYYRTAALEIKKVSFVMGEILDSMYVKTLDVPQYLNRTTQYLDALGDVVDIWEVGNEINGEWLGANADVVAKMAGAYDLVKARNKIAALTLYYNQDCWSRASNEMFTWTAANVPARMKQGLDYVLISYYEDDCNGLRPDWPVVFKKLAQMFPNSKIGFGEVGTAVASRKADYLTRYYTMKIAEPNFVGGYFWWYFRQDMVPDTKGMWSTLNAAIVAP